ncbi:MAG: heme biosynthesis HemY N-terminal domain-containing protein [Pseudomonadota bacterium]
MKTLVLVLVVLALAAGLLQLQVSDPGVLSVNYAGWIVETSPIAFAIAFVVLVLAIMLTIKLLNLFFGLPKAVRNRTSSGRQSRAQKRLAQGFAEFTEGRWAQADKRLTRAIDNSDTALINHLTAARAAQEMGNLERRDALLEDATTSSPQSAAAVDITRAELQLDAGDLDGALETLVFLRSSAPRNARVINLLAQVYREREDWSKLDALFPVIQRYDAFQGEALEALQRDSYRGMIMECEESRLGGYWKRLPRNCQQDPELLALMADRSIADGKPKVAEKLLRDRLNNKWEESLLPVYARVELEDPARQLDYAERWLGEHGRSAALLQTLGQLCLRCQLWGKARVYLESSLGMEETPEAHLLLAELLTQLNETELASKHYASGLRLALSTPSLKADIKTASTALQIEQQPAADLKLVES